MEGNNVSSHGQVNSVQIKELYVFNSKFGNDVDDVSYEVKFIFKLN
jgi:hypothetical protein